MTRGGTGTDHEAAITVVIADDHLAFGEALEIVLGQEDDLQVIEVVTDGAAAIEAVHRHEPDVVIMDMAMPGMDGIEATRRIIDEAGDTQVIVLSGTEDVLAVGRAVQAGARGYLRKTDAVGDLPSAIRRAFRGDALNPEDEVSESLGRLRHRRAQDGNLEQRMQRLTPRELEILQRIANGETNAKIASELEMSPNTLRTHTQNVLTKLGVHSKLDAIVAAIRHGKVSTTPPANGGTNGDRQHEPA
jgi:DNA-binding NarL/FixJ family response regulator